MTERCPNCGTARRRADSLTTIAWGEKRKTYCSACNTAENRRNDAPTLTVDDIEHRRTVVRKWDKQRFRAYVTVDGTPGCIDFSARNVVEAGNRGNPAGLEHRLQREFNREVDLSDAPKAFAETLLSNIEEYAISTGTVLGGDDNE